MLSYPQRAPRVSLGSQVRTLRDEIAKLEKVETLRMAVALIKEVKMTVAEAEALAASAPPAAKDEPMPPAADGSAEPPAAPTANAAAADEPMPAADSVEPNALAQGSAEAAPATDRPAEAAEVEEKRKASELAWRRKLAAAFRELRRSEHVKHAFEVACPGMVEKAVAADAKAEKEETQEEEQEQDADLLSLGIGPEHVKRLFDELQS
ncbi:unnamed protein product [Symbiodinium natans]|uniref:Uncharacterized protein n=1 Tax=Symbiodinium natans TaxID=878477 RepID=A0A812PDZ2_9DINO|nr:unnamed protein product [Symbiodinium natans]